MGQVRMNSISRQKYVESLESEVQRYKGILEYLFGPCDPRFVFGTIRKSEDGMPRTFYPAGYHTEGGCIVDIHISDFSWEHCSPHQGKWQVAHECVHLLDLGIDGTTNLEEGLATWFQDESRFHDDTVRQYIARNTRTLLFYDAAKDLVLRCMPQLTTAVKEIRESGKRIREISPDVLATRLPHVDRKMVESLCNVTKPVSR